MTPPPTGDGKLRVPKKNPQQKTKTPKKQPKNITETIAGLETALDLISNSNLHLSAIANQLPRSIIVTAATAKSHLDSLICQLKQQLPH